MSRGSAIPGMAQLLGIILLTLTWPGSGGSDGRLVHDAMITFKCGGDGDPRARLEVCHGSREVGLKTKQYTEDKGHNLSEGLEMLTCRSRGKVAGATLPLESVRGVDPGLQGGGWLCDAEAVSGTMRLRGGKGKRRGYLLGKPLKYNPQSIGAGHSTKSAEAKEWRAHRDARNRANKVKKVRGIKKPDEEADFFKRLTRQRKGLLDPKDAGDSRLLKRMEPKLPCAADRHSQFGLPPAPFVDPRALREAQRVREEEEAVVLAGGSGPISIIGGERRLNMTFIRNAPDFSALNLTLEEEEEVYRQESVRYQAFADKVDAVQATIQKPPLGRQEVLDVRLREACIAGDLVAARAVIAKGANIEQPDKLVFYDGGYRPLHHACLWGHLPIVQALLGMGADVAARTGDFFEETAMHCAARGGRLEVIKELANAGHPVDAVNCWDWTPLHYAARAGHVDACAMLVDRGANASHSARPWKDQDMHFLKGMPGSNPNPCQLAFVSGQHEVVEFFRKRGLAPSHLMGAHLPKTQADVKQVEEPQDQKDGEHMLDYIQRVFEHMGAEDYTHLAEGMFSGGWGGLEVDDRLDRLLTEPEELVPVTRSP